MGKSEVGPDMQDCSVMWSEIQKAQECSTTILMELAGCLGGSHLRVHVLSVSRTCMPWEAEWCVASTLIWPNRENKTFEGALFRALIEHDAVIDANHRAAGREARTA